MFGFLCVPTFNWKPPQRPWVTPKSKSDANSSRGRSSHAYEPRYKTRRWQRIREIALSKSPLCVHCRDVGRVTPARVVDHITPVRRGGSFWSLENLQTLCDACHNHKSGRESHGLERVKGGRGVQINVADQQKTIGSSRVNRRETLEGGS
jgi:hypothetical protein